MFEKEQTEDVEKITAQVNALAIADAVCAFPDTGKAFTERENVRAALQSAAQALKGNEKLPTGSRLSAVQAQEDFMRVMKVYFTSHRDDLDGLFRLFDACARGQLQASIA